MTPHHGSNHALARPEWLSSQMITLTLVVIALGSSCTNGGATPCPMAEEGRLDLSDWDFDADGPASLDGDWELYWSELVSPESFQNADLSAHDGFLSVPSMWNGFEMDGQRLGANGYATFRLRVTMPANDGDLAMRFHSMGTAYTLFANGEEVVATGVVGTTRDTSQPDWRPLVVDLNAESGELDLVLHMSNFHHRKGGPVEKIELGSSAELNGHRERAVAFQMFLAGAILIIGLYHLCLILFRRRDRAPFLFGLFCLLLGLYTLLSGERYLATLFPDLSWAIRVRLTNLTSFLSLPVFLMFIDSLFPQDLHRLLLKVVQGVMGILVLLVLFTPARIYTRTIPVFHLLTLVGCVAITITLIRARMSRKGGAGVLLVGFVFFMITIINDVLYDNLIIYTGQYLYVGLFVFIFSQSVLLSHRFSKAYQTIELQSQELALASTTHRTLEAKFIQSQKMEAIGTLAGGVAHDFRNQLTVIAGFTGLLLEDEDASPQQLEHLRLIQDAAARSTTLTSQLLSFSRKQILQPENIDLDRVVAHVAGTLSRMLPEDIEVEINRTDGGAYVFVDRAQLEQAIMNMAINARDAMPEGGILRFETGLADLGEDETGPGKDPGTYARLEIRDSGHGMDEETQKQVFEPFFTTKKQGKGTGLGLSMVYGLAQQSGGWAAVESEPGVGTGFRIYLPLGERPAFLPSLTPPPPRSDSGTETILVAEDDPGVRQFIVKALEQFAYTILAPEDVLQALELAEQHPGDIDLLISDVVMPTMSGPVLAENIEAIRPGIPVLYVSGYTMDALQKRGVIRSGIHLMTKPFSSEELATRVREMFDTNHRASSADSQLIG